MTTTGIVLLIAAAIIVIAVFAWYLLREQRSRRLRSRFGPEYDDVLRHYGDRPRAEHALAGREKRMEKIHIRPLSHEEHERFGEQWHNVQARFVDDPPGSIHDADQLVCEVMRARGYPMSEFDRRVDDLSVDHPLVVRNYRLAHEIAESHDKGQASTEDLRQALVYYRDLFDDLLEAHVSGHKGMRR